MPCCLHKNIRQCFFLIIFISVLPVTSLATEFKDDEYLNFVTEVFAKAKEHRRENYEKLSELYVQTSFYDPFFPPTEINKILAKIEQSQSEAETKSLVTKLFQESEKHTAHIDTHMAMYKFWIKMNNENIAKRYADIANHIAAIVYESGDGLTPQTAFKAINKSEQHFVLYYILKKKYSTKRTENIDGDVLPKN